MNIDVESKITLDKFQLRWYQEELWDAIENHPDDVRRVLYIAPRRAGKDISCWNLAIRQCLRKTCLVMYCLPTYAQARSVIFDGITSCGQKFLEYIPKALIESINQSEMKIRFKNGSILQCVGAMTYNNSLIGTNPYGIVLSEFALMENGAEVFNFVRPILAANGGWAVLVSTPRGMNHMFHLYKLAQELPGWHVIYQKTSEIQHIPQEVLMEERAQMSEELYMQEFECSFSRGIEGSYYGKYIDKIRNNGQICDVPYEHGLQVHLAFDIGVNDPTSIIWYQVLSNGAVIRIIDCYSNTGHGLDHYANIIRERKDKHGYVYGKMFAPHDIKVREWGAGAITRLEKAKQLGLDFVLLDQIGVQDGIENVWTHFNKFWIDQTKCRSLINALENYRREWDEQRQIYKNKPVHNWASNYADALRYMCMSLHKTQKGLTSEEFERKKYEAMYGDQGNLPRFFRDDPRYDRYR